jgi:predicted transposase/invertase (TIGR01784 family)
MSTYINPFTDFGFKRLFGTEDNKDLLVHFLQNLLQKREGKVTSIRFLKSDQLPYTRTERAAIFDIYCETERGEKIIVELQKARQDFFKDRSIFYSTFPIRRQAKRGSWDFRLSAVYTIGILDFIFAESKMDSDKFFHHIQLSDTDTHEVFYDKLTFIYLEMPKFRKQEGELETPFDKWLYVLKNLAELQNRPPALQERIFRKLFHIAEVEALAPRDREAYDESLKRYWDFQNVVDSAARQARKDVAKEKNLIIQQKEEERKQAVKEKEEAVKEKNKVAKEREAAVKEKEKVAKEKEKVVKEKEKAVKEKEKVAKEKEKAVKEKEKAVKEKNEAIKAKEAEKEAIVKNLLQKGSLPDFISEVTGLSLQRIGQIKRDVN